MRRRDDRGIGLNGLQRVVLVAEHREPRYPRERVPRGLDRRGGRVDQANDLRLSEIEELWDVPIAGDTARADDQDAYFLHPTYPFSDQTSIKRVFSVVRLTGRSSARRHQRHRKWLAKC